jgi:ribonuclease P protein component
MDFKFGKEYKLCSKKIIEQVYRNGSEIKSFPFYLKYMCVKTESTPFQIVFVVPKKKYRHATTRNQIRRYIREAVRLEKEKLENQLNKDQKSLALFLVYAGEQEMSLKTTQNDIAKLFKKLIYDLNQTSNK